MCNDGDGMVRRLVMIMQMAVFPNTAITIIITIIIITYHSSSSASSYAGIARSLLGEEVLSSFDNKDMFPDVVISINKSRSVLCHRYSPSPPSAINTKLYPQQQHHHQHQQHQFHQHITITNQFHSLLTTNHLTALC